MHPKQTSTNPAVQKRNTAIAQTLMTNFQPATWFAHLHEDVVLAFPFAASIGLPDRVEGRADAMAYLTKIMDGLPGLIFNDIEISPMLDPDSLLIEYTSEAATASGRYQNTYVAVHSYQDSKLVYFKEYWNTKVVLDVFGSNPAAAFA
jgi:ketosteroid isomerase-like protein